MKTDSKPRREVKELIAFRPSELAPLLNLWMARNPSGDITAVIKQSIKLNPEIRKLAGKRYAHLVGDFQA